MDSTYITHREKKKAKEKEKEKEKREKEKEKEKKSSNSNMPYPFFSPPKHYPPSLLYYSIYHRVHIVHSYNIVIVHKHQTKGEPNTHNNHSLQPVVTVTVPLPPVLSKS
jgi:hypothetical protein